MNLHLLVEIGKLAMSVLHGQLDKGSKGSQQLEAAQSLLRIVEAGAEAYQQHTGQPLDPSLVKPQPLV